MLNHFMEKIRNNIDAIKLLAYSNIQIGNLKVIEVLEDGYEKREELRDFDFYNYGLCVITNRRI